jgi:hypothetical protein
MSTSPTYTTLAVAASLALATAAGAQEPDRRYGSMTPPSALAGACAGSTSGGGLGRAGQQATETHYCTPGVDCDIRTANGPVSASVTKGGIAPQQMHAHASADYGLVRVFAESHHQNWQNQGLQFPRSFAQAGFVDQVTFDAPGLTGQQGSFTALIHIEGSYRTAGDQGCGGYRVSGFDAFTLYGIDIDEALQCDDPALHAVDHVAQATFQFIFGTPFKIGLFAFATAGNRSEGGLNHLPGDVVVDFDDTITWQGFQSVMAASGPVSSYTVTSLSGDDWINGQVAAVPEPATLTLVAGGLIALAIAARRRRAST